jgi:hypothetical protein
MALNEEQDTTPSVRKQPEIKKPTRAKRTVVTNGFGTSGNNINQWKKYT